MQEIFEPALSDIKTDARHKFDSLPKDPSIGRELGRGTFSKASEDESDPHMVTKTQMRKSTFITDMFDEYAEVITKGKLWNMVHFPRVYATKRYVDPQGDVRHRWSMEKLIPLNHPSITRRDMQSLSERYFTQEAYDEVAEDEFHISSFADMISSAVMDQEFDLIKDPTLKKACIKLSEIHRKLGSKKGNYINIDLHDENIMFRRSHHGLDAVFSDPFVADGSSVI